MKKLLPVIFALIIVTQLDAQIFVDQGAVGSNNGTSWTNAYNDLANAMLSSTAGDTLWVKEGNYYPSFDTTGSIPSLPAQRSFWLKNGVVVYGGFVGTETNLSQRDPVNHKATLNGEFGASVYAAHVITVYSNIDSTAVMDGFTVTNGVAIPGSVTEHGGGILLYGDAWFYNMAFNNNYASQHGGAVYSNYSESKFINCSFYNNGTQQYDGGAVNFNYSNIEMYNCVFRANNANRFGGAVTSVISDVKLQNCTFVGNTSPYNIFQHSVSGTLSIFNSIFDNNTAPAPVSASGTLDFDDGVVPNASWSTYCPTCLVGAPTFINAAAGNFGLVSTSMGVDETLTGAYTNPYVDIAGNTRLVGTSMDMGAYEYQGNAEIAQNYQELKMQIFPNPTSSTLTILTEENIETITIVTLTGEVVQQEIKNSFSVENISSGFYIVQIKTTDGMSGSTVFIKE